MEASVHCWECIVGRKLDWRKDRNRRLANARGRVSDEQALVGLYSRGARSRWCSKAKSRALADRAVALALPTKARAPDRERVKFFGTRPAFEKIMLALSDFVEIRHLSDDRIQIALGQGVFITWFLSTKTVQFQGAGKAAETLKSRFLTMAGSAATEERRR